MTCHTPAIKCRTRPPAGTPPGIAMTRRLLAATLLGLLAPAGSAQFPTGSTGQANPAAVPTVQPGLGLTPLVRTAAGASDAAGTLSFFAGNFAPGGWRVADGSSVSRTEFAGLFAQTGTTYGSASSTTFNLPNLAGRVAIGDGQGPGLSSRPTGQVSGTAGVALTVAQLPSHTHTVPGGTTTAVGGGQAINNMQPSLAVNYTVVNSGAYPPREGGGGTATTPFFGEVRMTAAPATPSGQLSADGQTLNINQNTALFSLLGTNYGGNGSSTFAPPDLRGRTAVGQGAGPGLTARQLGEAFGTESSTLTVAQLPAHTHTLSGGGSTGVTGQAAPVATSQPSLALRYLIATTGVFPSRDDGFDTDGAFLGRVTLFAGTFTPDGWAEADGRLLPINQNQALFALLGPTYGGNGQTNFALPDLRGRTAVGAGAGPEFSLQLGEYVGSESVSLTLNNLPAHIHLSPVPEPAGLLAVLAVAGGVLARRRQ